MKLHNIVQNEAIVSNVGEIGEFRIRNSAKAFNILSSGLYANKIRAIIRELSCNAVDSHVAAGKSDVPFDVHLPNAIEPWFSIRDYGTGLSHDQVTNIYTTYFESTKTGSNDFIGALGLGSKSPFSYTDNFTVTAVQNGRKGIYTAFINEQGVPSIALMMEEETTDPNGVEVRFAVEQSHDFRKFRDEAANVYTFFKLRPVVSGYSEFKFNEIEYVERDIIPGVHTQNSRDTSYAVMGNIAYPIDVPNSCQTLGSLSRLVEYGNLVMEFEIGELDFQASREGLSYIPETIAAIKNKLEQLNVRLAEHVAERANAIENKWERAEYLVKLGNESLWQEAVAKYVTDSKFDMFDANARHLRVRAFNLTPEELAEKHNIVLRGFMIYSHNQMCHTVKAHNNYNHNIGGYSVNWNIDVNPKVNFVINDTKIGALERAKYHWKNSNRNQSHRHGYGSHATVYVIEAFDKTKPVDTDGFFALIKNPPTNRIHKASALLEKERAQKSIGRDVTIMSLQRRGSHYRYRESEMVWRDAGKSNQFDSNTTYYYLPLSGFISQGVVKDVKEFQNAVQNSGLLGNITIYGVRKTDLEWAKSQKNWINLDDAVRAKLVLLNTNDVMGMVKSAIDFKSFYCYNEALKLVDSKSPYLELYNEFKDVKSKDPGVQKSIKFLCEAYQVETKKNIDPSALITKYNNKIQYLKKRYPLLDELSKYSRVDAAVAEYINAIDIVKAK